VVEETSFYSDEQGVRVTDKRVSGFRETEAGPRVPVPSWCLVLQRFAERFRGGIGLNLGLGPMLWSYTTRT